MYLAVRVLGRLLFPRSGQNSGYFSGNRERSEGDITVEDNKSDRKNINKNEGDYIDYEEVKED